MINLEQDHRWIIAIYKENTLQEAKERLQTGDSGTVRRRYGHSSAGTGDHSASLKDD